MTNRPGANETVHTRIIDAPREAVFDAWTTPELFAQWWGPNGFTTTIRKFEVKPGGQMEYTMHGPNGVDYPNESVFEEINRPERIVLFHVAPVHQFHVIADFEDLSGQTRITFCQRFESEAELKKVKKLVVRANEENLDRLTEVVMNMKASQSAD